MSVEVSKESSGRAANASSSKQSLPDNEEAVFNRPIELQPKRDTIIKASKNQENVVAENGSTVHNSQSNLLSQIPYNVPDWGGFPGPVYWFEMIKEGQIIEKFYLGMRSWRAIGRLPVNDIVMLHPTISRFHAVIQFRDNEKGTAENPPGMYIFDLKSVHGTFLNENRIEKETYIRVHVGHVLKFGGSTRHLILHGPEEEEKEEALPTMPEIQKKQKSKKRKAADDFPDSDDDTFLDRMETVEEKRKARVGAMTKTKTLTYSDLLKDREEVMKKMTNVTATLTAIIQAGHQGQGVLDKEIGTDDDSLDDYIKTLQELPDPKDANRVSELRMTRNELKTEAICITGLLNRVRPLCVPEFSEDIENLSTNPTIHRKMSALNRKARNLSKKRNNVKEGSVEEPDTSDFKLEPFVPKSYGEDTKLPRSNQITHTYHIQNINININLTPATFEGLLEGKTVKSGSVKGDLAVGGAKIVDVSPELSEREYTAKRYVGEPKGEGKKVLEGTKKKWNREKLLPKNAKPQKERQQATSEWLIE